MKGINKILPIIFILCLCACKGKQSQNVNFPVGHTDNLSFAKGFSITHSNKYTTVTVYNPWKKGIVYDRYYLVKNPKISTPGDGHKVVIPLKTVMANSDTHIGFINAIGEIDKVIGICNANYIYNPTIQEKVKQGKVKDLGEAFNLNIEKLLMMHPQAIFTTAYNAEDENSRRMRQTGLTIIYNIEWQEKSLLGRAEWIKFMGAFFDKELLADSIFNKVVSKYNEVKAIAQKAKSYPSVMSGQDFRGTWSLPGGNSYTGQLFHDAHINYRYATDTSKVSIPSNVEEVMINFHDADIWIGTDAHSSLDLSTTNPKYKLFKAYRNRQVYNINKRVNPKGGNDYWESGVVRPDLLLSDMIKIAHPELLPKYQMTYMERLK
jgi:iron complex transport system substrate-binding protein